MSDPSDPVPPAGDGAAAGADEGAHDGAAPPPRAPTVDSSVCLCGGLGPLLTQALRSLTVPEELKRTVHDTEREGLRLLRTLIELRLSSLGPDGPDGDGRKGTRVTVE